MIYGHRHLCEPVLAHDAIPRLLVLCLRARHDILGEGDALLCLEARLDKPVTEVLLVERRLGLALDVGVCRPVAGRVGGERLVDEDEFRALRREEEAKLELCVREDEAALERVRCGFVWRQRISSD